MAKMTSCESGWIAPMGEADLMKHAKMHVPDARPRMKMSDPDVRKKMKTV